MLGIQEMTSIDGEVKVEGGDKAPEETMALLKRIVSGEEEAVDDDEDGSAKKKKETDGAAVTKISGPSFFKASLEYSKDPIKDEVIDTAEWRGVSVPLAPVLQDRSIAPISTPDKKESATENETTEEKNHGKELHPERRVLVVDDSLAVRRFVQRTFERQGYRVDVCQNGWQAFAQMQNNLYDFVFLDIEMPVMNGFRCVQALRDWENKVNRKDKQMICALTSHTELHERQLSEDLGMNFFEAKPTRPQRLLDIVNQAVTCAKGNAHASAALTAIATANACGKLDDLYDPQSSSQPPSPQAKSASKRAAPDNAETDKSPEASDSSHPPTKKPKTSP